MSRLVVRGRQCRARAARRSSGSGPSRRSPSRTCTIALRSSGGRLAECPVVGERPARPPSRSTSATRRPRGRPSRGTAIPPAGSNAQPFMGMITRPVASSTMSSSRNDVQAPRIMIIRRSPIVPSLDQPLRGHRGVPEARHEVDRQLHAGRLAGRDDRVALRRRRGPSASRDRRACRHAAAATACDRCAECGRGDDHRVDVRTGPGAPPPTPPPPPRTPRPRRGARLPPVTADQATVRNVARRGMRRTSGPCTPSR